jgi:hypothetical protein
MNFSFYIYGTPDGYNQYPADSNSIVLKEFEKNNNSESQLTIYRKGPLVYYAYMRKLQEKADNYLGFCLVFNGIYCNHPQKLFLLFDRAFDDLLMKGELLKFENGKIIYSVKIFAEKLTEIERILTYIKNDIESDLNRYFTVISPLFKVGNGSKTISARNSRIEILTEISEFDCVYITNNEKSLSELERTHKLLTDLYTEKQELDNKYNKLIVQKKQYKVVLFLCMIVIGCAIGLLAFSSSLKSRDSQIGDLNRELEKQKIDFENLNIIVDKLKMENKNIKNEKINLKLNLDEFSAINENLSYENEQLTTGISNQKYTIQDLESQNNQYRRESSNLQSKIQNLQSDVDKLEKYEPQTYKVISKTDYYYKLRCNISYEETNCYSDIGSYIKVYMTSNGYALTEYGWTKLSNLSKY